MFKNGKYVGNIYIVTCLINNKIYIGQTRNELYDRWAGHKHDAQRREYHTAFSKAIKKYGSDNFKMELLEKIEVDTEDELNNKLNEREIYYISKYHSLTHENGYNITKGGDNIGKAQKVTTYCFTPDGEFVKEFESRADAGRFIGVKGEDVAGAIIRKGLCRGYYFTSSPTFDYNHIHPMSERKIKSYDYNGKLIKLYNNSYEASNDIGGSAENIYNCCNGQHTSAYGFIWRFQEDEFNSHKLPNKMTRCINQYSMDNKYINTFNSIKDAAEYLNIKRPNISAVLSNKYASSKSAGGYHWYYANDPNQPDPTKIMQVI